VIKVKVKSDEAIFILSIDTELAWGSFDRDGLKRLSNCYSQEREIISSLLKLLERYGISATWAIVGHLFLDRCSREGPHNHNQVLQPDYSWYPQGWLSHDPFSSKETDPFFYAPDIVDTILASSQKNEIASHTFTHVILGDPGCSREVATSQLAECRSLAEAKGVELISLVFPRNSVGHLDVLCEQGFVCFRGVERNWYHRLSFSGTSKRFFHFLDRFLAVCPPVYDELDCYACESTGKRLVNLPASMFYIPFGGLWSMISISTRVRQAKKGLSEAIKRKAIFHLWFHPVNLTTSPLLLQGLEEILSCVKEEVEKGNLASMTMGQAATNLLIGL
jgi:hypothetical protein